MSDNGSSTAIVRAGTAALELSAKDAQTKLLAIREFQRVVKTTFIEGHDFGTIPGTPKPTLLKPGAEKIAKLLNLQDDYDIIEKIEDWEGGFFYYLIRCRLTDIASGVLISSGMGSCNSKEGRYAFRWVSPDKVPPTVDKASLETRGGKKVMFEPDFALSKKETTGQWGKPKEYWESFDLAIKDKRAIRTKRLMGKGDRRKEQPGWEISIDSIEYQVPNKDIFTQVNTMLKMAKKRALVDVALSVGRLSDLFTQDLEDIMPGGIVETTAEPVEGEAPTPAGDEPAKKDPEEKPHQPAEAAPISEETKNKISELIAQACAGGKRTTEKVLAQIREWVKFSSNREIAKIPDDLTQDEAARVITALSNLKDVKK